LHKTPGDQEKDAAISNYDVSKPSLWEQMQRNRVEVFWQNIFYLFANKLHKKHTLKNVVLNKE
jgi:hypothetical protein